MVALQYAYFFTRLRLVGRGFWGSGSKNDQCQTPCRPLAVSWKTYPPFFISMDFLVRRIAQTVNLR